MNTPNRFDQVEINATGAIGIVIEVQSDGGLGSLFLVQVKNANVWKREDEISLRFRAG